MHLRVLRELVEEVAKTICTFKKSLQSGEVTIDWKKGSITHTFEKGNKEGLRNYRPVSLTSVSDRTMEQILLEFMCVENQVNSDTQHGFTRALIRLGRCA